MKVGKNSPKYIFKLLVALILKDQILRIFTNMLCKNNTVVLISPQPDQEGNKLVFLSEWREFPWVPCLAKKKIKKKLDDSSRLDVVEIAHVPGTLPSLFPSWSG